MSNAADAALRRLLDVTVAGTLLLVLAPFLGVLALLVRETSTGPALFRQIRIGRNGQPFVLLKLRTMRADAPGPVITSAGDPRITRLGAWLRRTKLDELPQLWNVLRGDMSLVGPRPIRPRFFEELAADLPAYWQRLVVRPGLTGFAQIRRGYETSMAEKLAHDLEWIADRSVRLYLRTLWTTGIRVLRQVFD